MNSKYALVIDGKVTRYPIYRNELEGILGHNRLTIQEFADANIYIVFSSDKGSEWNKNYVPGTPSFDGNVWKETWEEVDASDEEIEQRLSHQWDRVRHLRNKLLSISDYTQLPDAPLTLEKKQEFEAYRQQLRDITEQPDPFDIWFPEAPDA